MRAILTYHSIDDSSSSISVSPSVFATHVEWFRSGRVPVVSIPELLRLPPDADAVALTFDDGFCNFGSIAAPMLQGLPVTLFVVIDHVGLVNDWGGRTSRGIPTLPLLDWPALARLAGEGVTLGAHTRTHADLTTLSSSAIEDELAGSVERLRARTGVEPAQFAYPYGRFTPAIAAAAARWFHWGCTAELRPLRVHETAVALPRLDMYYFRRPGRLEWWGTPRLLTYLACRRTLRLGRELARTARARFGVASA